MIKLITIEDEKPVFSPEVKMFAPFRKIIERDKGGKIVGDHDGRKKYVATRELAFIYWYCDPRSTYKETYIDEKARVEKLKKMLDLPDNWKMDEIIKDAVSFYLEEIKEDYDIRSIDDAIMADSKTGEYLRNVDYSLQVKGKPVYDPVQINKIITGRAGVIDALNVLRQKVLKGEAINKKIKAGHVLKRFENMRG